MKKTLTLAALLFATACRAATVNTDTNGVVNSPNNFFRANSNGINAVISASDIASGTLQVARLPGAAVTNNRPSVFFYSLSLSNLVVTNLVILSGGGYWSNAVLDGVTLSNAVNYGAAFSSPGSVANSEQFGTDALADGDAALAVGKSAAAGSAGAIAVGNSAGALGEGSTAIGYNAQSISDSNALAIGRSASVSSANGIALGAFAYSGHKDAVAIGTYSSTTATNQIMLGSPGISVFVHNNGTIQSNASVGLDISIGDDLSVAGDSSFVGPVTLGSTVTNIQALGPATFNSTVGVGSLSAGTTGTFGGNVAIGGSATVSSNLTVGGSIVNIVTSGRAVFPTNSGLAFNRHVIASLANGNNSAIPVGTNSFLELSGPSGAFTNCGFANGYDGQLVIVLNQTGQNMVFSHENGNEATPANRVTTMTGGDRGTTGNGAGVMIYSGAASRWILLSIEQ